MKSPFSIIGLATAISVSCLLVIGKLPDMVMSLGGNDWLALMVLAAALTVLLLTQTYTMSARIAARETAWSR